MSAPSPRLLRFAFMRLTRELDARFENLLLTGRVAKWYSEVGNEATTVPAGLALAPGDVLATLHRDLGAILAVYLDPARAFPGFGLDPPDGSPADPRPEPVELLYRLACQLLGRGDGFSQGIERSFHYAYLDPPAGIRHVGMISHLGAMIPVAAGCAFGLKQAGSDRVALNFIGDGGTSTGDFHEGLNMAAVWKLPLVLVIENNRYAFATPWHQQYAARRLSDRGPGYGIAAETVDGNDPDAMAQALERAVARARRGQGPTLIEAMLGRMRGHSEGDDSLKVVPPEELERYLADDPVPAYRARLLAQGDLDEATAERLEARIAMLVEHALEAALGAAPPDPAIARREVFAAIGAAAGQASAVPEAPGIGGPRTDAETALAAGPPARAGERAGEPRGAQNETGRAAAPAPVTPHRPDPDMGSYGAPGVLPRRKAGEPTVLTSYVEAIHEALGEELERDPSVILLGQDIAVFEGAFRVTRGFHRRWPDRVLDTPIAESGTIGIAVGAAMLGYRPVVEMQFADFITCGFNQLVNMAAKLYYRWRIPCPIVVRLPAGGGVGAGPFHSQNPEGWFAHTAGLKVVCPATAADARDLLRASIRDPNPVVFCEHKYLYRRVKEVLPENGPVAELGRARVAREGRDVTLIGYGASTWACLEAAEELTAESVAAEVVDLRTLVPLDEETVLRSVRKTGRALVVHEAQLTGGFGGEVAARIADRAFAWLDAPVRRLAYPDRPVPYVKALEQELLPGKERVVSAARELMRY